MTMTLPQVSFQAAMGARLGVITNSGGAGQPGPQTQSVATGKSCHPAAVLSTLRLEGSSCLIRGRNGRR